MARGALLAAAGALLPTAGAAPLAPATARTTSGLVSGEELDGRLAFRGIPYAAPPLGDLRFRPPQEHAGWDGVLAATDFGPGCMQYPGGCWKSQNLSSISEDCLTLNILAPAPLATGKHPVVVYIHAGEFRCGSSNDAESNWLSFAHDVVYVSFNYRVGALGFLAADELRGRHPRGGTGSYGLLDQRRALEWVQENIAAFGGDPGAVTIMGESSGGTSVAYHLTIGGREPTALFGRAILESPGLTQIKHWDDAMANTRFALAALAAAGSPGCNRSGGYDAFRGDLLFGGMIPLRKAPLMLADDAMRWCDTSAECVGFSQMPNQTVFARAPGRVFDVESRGGTYEAYVKRGPVEREARLECLLSADAQLLTSLTDSVPRDDTFETDAWGPVLDGVDLPEPILARVRRGDVAAGVDVLAGYNLDEGTEFMSLTPPLKCAASQGDLEQWFADFLGPGELASIVAPLYKPEKLERPLPACRERPSFSPGHLPKPGSKISGESAAHFNAAMRMAGDKAIRCPTNVLARASTGRSFVYQFELTPSYTENFDDTTIMGAFHGAEVPFVFGAGFELRTPFERNLSATMGCYWRSFVVHGDPGVERCSSPPWPQYVAAAGWPVLFLGAMSAAPQPASALPTGTLAAQRCDAFDAAATDPQALRANANLHPAAAAAAPAAALAAATRAPVAAAGDGGAALPGEPLEQREIALMV